MCERERVRPFECANTNGDEYTNDVRGLPQSTRERERERERQRCVRLCMDVYTYVYGSVEVCMRKIFLKFVAALLTGGGGCGMSRNRK